MLNTVFYKTIQRDYSKINISPFSLSFSAPLKLESMSKILRLSFSLERDVFYEKFLVNFLASMQTPIPQHPQLPR